MEEWRDVPGFEGKYQVSDFGNVRSVDRIDSENHFRKGQIMAQRYVRGYARVGLRDGEKQKMYSVHRLVAEAFIPNPDNLPQVNHKDEKPGNNALDNLEWCDVFYNINYGGRNKKVSRRLTGRINTPGSKRVEQYTKKGEYIRTFDSMADAEREVGVFSENISAVCRGKQKTAGGYKWKYAS